MKTRAVLALAAVLLIAVAASIWPAYAQSNQAVPGLYTLQVTIGASATQITTKDTPCLQVIFQNNATHTMRVGDANASSTRGALLGVGPPGGSVNIGPWGGARINLNQFYV